MNKDRMRAITAHWDMYAEDLKQIAEPLMNFLGINYFGHAVVTPDRRYFIIATDARPLEYSHQNYSIPVSGLTNYDYLENSFLFPAYEDDDVLGWTDGMGIELKDRFNMANPMMMIRKTHTISEMFYFTMDHHNAYEKYCNQKEDFEKYIFYYKDKARKIIDECKRTMNIFGGDFSRDQEVEISSRKSLPSIKKYWLNYGDKEICLSRSEYRALEKIAHGKTAKESGMDLYCGMATIQKHIENMKIKNDIYSTSDLIQLYWENRF